MKLKKPDEMERSHNLKSARNAFMFLAMALLIWGFYDLFVTGNGNMQLAILFVGIAIFFLSRIILNKKIQAIS